MQQERHTVKFKVRRAERLHSRFVLGVMLNDGPDQQFTRYWRYGPTYAARYGCSRASSTVIRFLGSKVYLSVRQVSFMDEIETSPEFSTRNRWPQPRHEGTMSGKVAFCEWVEHECSL